MTNTGKKKMGTGTWRGGGTNSQIKASRCYYSKMDNYTLNEKNNMVILFSPLNYVKQYAVYLLP